MNYIHYISSPLVNGSHYGNRGFASPMKELNDQTVLVENGENRNDSYRQRTKYDDRVDSYFSTYDLGILLQNRDSYLEGKLDSNGDVDCYSFSYAQKSFYDKMGIGTKVTVRLENIPEGCQYDLVIYDKQGNQIGITKDNGDGSREITLPDWSGSDRYIIRVENRSGEDADADTEQPYRIRITEERYQKQTEADGGQEYSSEIEKLHREQHDSLPEDERYTGTESVEGLLEKKASGENLDEQEEKRKASDVLEEQFSDELWDCHMQASDYTTEEFNRINAYKEISDFLGKATGGQYSWDDISMDGNGNISGLPKKMCQLLNSQESNGRYEQLKDDILMLYDYAQAHGMEGLSDYKVSYEVAGSNIKIKNG